MFQALATSTPIGKMYGVNIGCLDGVSEEEVSKIPITYVDGMNDRWQETPKFFSSIGTISCIRLKTTHGTNTCFIFAAKAGSIL